jgi:hypothetical protein
MAFHQAVFDIVFQFHPQLAVIINGSETVVDLAGWEDETIFFGVGSDFRKNLVVIHREG